MDIKWLLMLSAIAGAVAGVIYLVLNNGSDTEWGLTSFVISWGLFLIERDLGLGPWNKQKQP